MDRRPRTKQLVVSARASETHTGSAHACGLCMCMCMWHVACGMWHVTSGMWYMACGMWYVAWPPKKSEISDFQTF